MLQNINKCEENIHKLTDIELKTGLPNLDVFS